MEEEKRYGGVEGALHSVLMDDLPYIDEHSRRIDASPDEIWDGLLRFARRSGSSTTPLARLLGCDPLHATPEFHGRPGDAIPGFRVAEAEPGRRLVLRGRHRFADYALTLLIDGGHLRAITHAAFPGLHGRLYRAAVIGSGGHRVVTRAQLGRMARAVRREVG